MSLSDERTTYSDSELYNPTDLVSKTQRPVRIESLLLEGHINLPIGILPFKVTKRLFIINMIDQVIGLRLTIHTLHEDIKQMAHETVYLEEKSTILTKQIERQRDDVKKTRMELTSTQHGLEHYRHMLQKYDINDTSVLERLTSTNQQLQDELREQRKQVYSLQQELYRVTRDYEDLTKKNQTLYSLVDKRTTTYRSSTEDVQADNKGSRKERSQRKHSGGEKKPSLWKRFKSLFRRKKRRNTTETSRQVQPVSLNPMDQSTSKLHHSSSSPVLTPSADEERYYTLSHFPTKSLDMVKRSNSHEIPSQKESVRLMKRESLDYRRSIASRNNSRQMTSSLSSSNLHSSNSISVSTRVSRGSRDKDARSTKSHSENNISRGSHSSKKITSSSDDTSEIVQL